MIEKAVELGVTDIHPITTDRTQNAKINSDKVKRYIIEATEQCERMSLPTLHTITKLTDCDFRPNTFAALERQHLNVFQGNIKDDITILIGPEGGWSGDEIDYLSNHKNITAVSLGDNILRAETAALFMLSRIG